MKVCPNCHKTYEEEVNFCPECGAKLEEEAASPAETAQEKDPLVPVPPEEEQQEESQNAADERSGGSGGEETWQEAKKERAEENGPRQNTWQQAPRARFAYHDPSFSARFMEAVPNGDNWKSMYFSFQGRICRSTFIFRWLFLILTGAVVSGVTTVLPVLAPVSGLVLFACFLSYLTLAVRRLHDRNHSGLWTVMVFVPLLAMVMLLFLIFARGEETANRFGDFVE